MRSFLLLLPLVFGVGVAAELPRVGDLEHPLHTGVASPGDYAVVIGIEEYYGLPPVPFAQRDASAFGDLMLYTRGIPDDRVRFLTGKVDRAQILKAVVEAGERTDPAGTVWVYFAGHGAADPDSGERALVGGNAQADLESFKASLVRLSEITRAAGRGGARVMLVMDACFTGTSRDGTPLTTGRIAVPPYAPKASPMVTQWFAASAGQIARPLEAAGHGAFTYFTIAALRGAADGELDASPDGTVDTGEMRRYVARMLRATQNFEQVPELVQTRDVSLIQGVPEAVRGQALVLPSGRTSKSSTPSSASAARPAAAGSSAVEPATPKPTRTFRTAPTTVATTTRRPSDNSRLGGGLELGGPLGGRLELHFPKGSVRSAGLRAIVTPAVTTSLYLAGGLALFTDFRLSDRWDLEATGGMGTVGDWGLAAIFGAAPQYDPPGPFQVNLGVLAFAGSGLAVGPDITVGLVW